MGAAATTHDFHHVGPTILAGLLESPSIPAFSVPDIARAADAVARTTEGTFVLAFKSRSDPAIIRQAAQQAEQAAAAYGRSAVGVVVVPYMTEGGRRVCDETGVSWFDLSGNGRIVARGLRIRVSGEPNAFASPGRSSGIFAPRSSRLIRWLLTEPIRPFSQRSVATQLELDESRVSRVVARLEEDGHLVRQPDRKLLLRNRNDLLAAWHDQYAFSDHALFPLHVAARSGEELTRTMADRLGDLGVGHAATGLSAAWQYNHFAGFRRATFFVERPLQPNELAQLRARDLTDGSNLWLVIPTDSGVFHGAHDVDGIRCVHAVQAYLDLKGHPERAREAADYLMAKTIRPLWKADGE